MIIYEHLKAITNKLKGLVIAQHQEFIRFANLHWMVKLFTMLLTLLAMMDIVRPALANHL